MLTIVPVWTHCLPKKYKIRAKHAMVQSHSNKCILKDGTVNSSIIPKDNRECAGVSAELEVTKNAVILLIRNINTVDGLENDALGVVKRIQWDTSHSSDHSDMPVALYLQFFDRSIGRNSVETSGEFQGLVKIEPLSAYFCNKSNITLQRTQFTLILSWACTVHKVQGLTLDSAVLDIDKKIFADGISYVALSRVKTLSGLAIASFHDKSIKTS